MRASTEWEAEADARHPITTGTNPDPATRPTLYTWPQPEEYAAAKNLAYGKCLDREAENNAYHVAGAPMPVYLKTGMYRHNRMGWVDTLYHADLVVGRTRAAVDPRTR